MEVFRAPRVTLIARPEFLEPEHLPVQWQGTASAGERLAEFAGRLCYMSQHNPAHRSTAEYLENIKKQGHGSVRTPPSSCRPQCWATRHSNRSGSEKWRTPRRRT